MADVNALAQILSVIQSAPDDKTRRAAEAELKKRELASGFPIVLLQIVAAPLSADANTQKVQNAVKWQAAIYFKNYVKRMWAPARDRDDDVKAPAAAAGAGAAAAGAAAGAPVDPISANDRELVKKNLAMLMLTAPPQLQKQLAEALQIIAASDFPKKWPALLPDLVQKLATKDYRVVNGVLETVASITNRYRYEMKSQTLWEEVDYVLKGFQQPLLVIYQQTYNLIGAAKNDATIAAQMPALMQAMTLIAKVFLALSAQDIPAFFEDHLKEFFMPFDGFLKYSNPALDSKDDTPGIVEQLKSTICDIVNLYTTKYDEQFEKYVGGFVGTIWGLLTTLKTDARFDDLVTSGIRFLTVAVTKEAHKPMFNDAARMKQICEMVIIPQLKLRDSDLDMFNDGLEYLRRDMEGSDVDTRRRTTVEFVRGLCVFFEKDITALLKNYIGVLLQAYSQNREKNYIAKDCAMYIVMALGAKGSTRKDGAVVTNPYIDVGQFYAQHVLPELQEKDVSKVPVLKADALKFLTVFRTQIPGAQYPNLMPLLAHLLSSSDYVVHTYAAIAIDRLLCVSDKGVARMGKDALKPMTQQLLTALFGVLGTAESSENEYVMKAIARVCRTAHDSITPYAKVIIEKVTSTLVQVAKQPKNPNFNHMLFETLACLISSMCPGTPALVDAFEGALLKPFQDILNMESATAFAPYIFQIFALMLEYRVGDVSAAYRSLFPMTYFPAMHENLGNIPPLTRLIQVYIMKAPQLVGAQSELVKVLGLFQRHLASKKFDVQAMNILQFIVEFLKPAQFAFALPTIIQLLNAKVKNSRFNAYLGVFFSTFVSLHGAEVLIEVGNKVQLNWFGQMLAQNVLGSVGTLTGVERKIVAVGLINMLCKSPVFVQEPFIKLYVKMLEAVVSIIELPAEPLAEDDEDALAAQANLGSNAQYSRLVFAESKLVTNHDPFAQIQDVRKYLAASLAAVTAQYRGKVPFAQLFAAVPAPVKAKLDAYLAAAGVQLSL